MYANNNETNPNELDNRTNTHHTDSDAIKTEHLLEVIKCIFCFEKLTF